MNQAKPEHQDLLAPVVNLVRKDHKDHQDLQDQGETEEKMELQEPLVTEVNQDQLDLTVSV